MMLLRRISCSVCVYVAIFDYVSSNRACSLDSRQLSYCDYGLPQDERIEDLLSRLNIPQKIALLVDNAAAVASIDLPAYKWWSEGLHGVGFSPGVNFTEPTTSATSFPEIITLSQSYNVDLFRAVGSAIATEVRAFANKEHAGLTFWTPNINIARDPRWGRLMETPGEDPLLNAAYATHFVRGMQDGEDSRYLKTSACCKHFAAYSLETLYNGTDRHSFDAIVTEQDMADTYLPAFEACVTKGGASGIMCSYNRINGIPACARGDLMTSLARDTWKFDGYITSDCGAIEDISEHHKYTTNREEACGVALKAGCDLDCGHWYSDHLPAAVEHGLITEEDMNTALRHLFKVQFRLGLFDPVEAQVYTKYGLDQVNSPEHRALALEAAQQTIVLLKNENKLLPLQQAERLKLALIGPLAMATKSLLGNYVGQPPYIVSPVEGVSSYGYVSVTQGCELEHRDPAELLAAKQAAANSDLSVLFIGVDTSVEDEGRDRTTISLPEPQRELAETVMQAASQPIIVVLFSGGAIDISSLYNDERVGAFLYAGLPGQDGGQALADILYGKTNPSGRLTQTFYREAYLAKTSFGDMRMRSDSNGYPGRTYRFLAPDTNLQLLPFGFGLSYTSFSVQAIACETAQGGGHRLTSANHMHGQDLTGDTLLNICFEVTNTGARQGRYSLLMFMSPPRLSPVPGSPLQALRAFGSVNLQPRESVVAEMSLTIKDVSLADEDGTFKVVEGDWTLFSTHDNELALVITVESGSLSVQ